MKSKESIHRDLQNGARLLLTDRDTDLRKSLREGTSSERMLKKAREYLSLRGERLEDFCVYLSQHRVKSSCCLDAVKKTLASSYMTPANFASLEQDPKMFPELAAHCKCGAIIPIRYEDGKLVVTLCDELQYVVANPLKFCARYLEIDPVQDRCPMLSRGRRIVIPSISERRDMFVGVMIQIW